MDANDCDTKSQRQIPPTSGNISDRKDYFNLLGLPAVPLVKILRHLNFFELDEMKYLNKSLFSFVNSQRLRLAHTEFKMVVINRKSTRKNYVYKYTTFDEVNIHGPVRPGGILRNRILKTEKEPFLEWLRKTQLNTTIRCLFLEKIHLTEKDLDIDLKRWSAAKLNISGICFEARENYSGDILPRLFRKINATSFLSVTRRGNVPFEDILTESFWEIVPTLERFDISDCYIPLATPYSPDLSRSVDRFPPSFSIFAAVMIPIDTVKKALHTWLSDETLRIELWEFRVASEYATISSMSTELEVPILTQDLVYRGRVNRIIAADGRVLECFSKFERENEAWWRIKKSFR